MLVAALAFVATLNAQTNDYVTKKDFQTENQKLTAKINATVGPSFLLRTMVSSQQQTIDSLKLLVISLTATNAASDARLKTIEEQTAMIQEQLNNTQYNTRSKVIYLLIIIALGGLILLGLLFFLWRKSEKTTQQLESDLEKSNEALNLYIQNNDVELESIRETQNRNYEELKRIQRELKNTIEQDVLNITNQIANALAMINEKSVALKNEIDQGVQSNSTRFTEINRTILEQKNAAEKTAKETVQALATAEQQLTKSLTTIQQQLKVLEEKQGSDQTKTAKTITELSTLVSAHLDKKH